MESLNSEVNNTTNINKQNEQSTLSSNHWTPYADIYFE